jgi:hypothetical protein
MKWKELGHMMLLTNLISQPSLDISPICIPLINYEGKNLRDQYDMADSSQVSIGFSPECLAFTPGMMIVVGIKLVSLILHSLL